MMMPGLKDPSSGLDDTEVAALAASCQKLFDAVDSNDPACVLKLLDEEFDGNPDFADVGGRTALMRCAWQGQPDMCECLIEKRADIHKQDDDGENSLMFAIGQSHDALVTLFISKGVDVCVPNKIGQTPLMKAVNKENVNSEYIKDLLAANAFIDATAQNGKTALMLAVERNNAAVVQALMDAGASAALKDKTGCTPLFPAAFRGNLDVMKVLIDKGADVKAEARSGTALMMNIDGAFKSETALFLIEKGCPLDYQNPFGDSALSLAVVNGNEEAVKMLLQAKADKQIKNKEGQTPLDIAKDAKRENLEILLST